MTGWTSVPVDDAGYTDSAHLAALPDDQLLQVIDGMRQVRYSGGRNHEGRWRDLMGLDELTGKDILDFGCGAGLEAAELSRNGNLVTVADIHPANVMLAQRVCRLYGHEARALHLYDRSPFFPPGAGLFDVFYASGSLHHSRYPVSIMNRVHGLLRPGGQARFMLYSDKGWRIATGAGPEAEDDGARERFIRFFDAVGDWADWYSRERLEELFGAWFTVERFAYLAPDERYCAAVLARRDW